jgi:hypothetical protein
LQIETVERTRGEEREEKGRKKTRKGEPDHKPPIYCPSISHIHIEMKKKNILLPAQSSHPEGEMPEYQQKK